MVSFQTFGLGVSFPHLLDLVRPEEVGVTESASAFLTLEDFLQGAGIGEDVQALDVFRALDPGLVSLEIKDKTDNGVVFGLVPRRVGGQDAAVLGGLDVRVQGVVGGAGNGKACHENS